MLTRRSLALPASGQNGLRRAMKFPLQFELFIAILSLFLFRWPMLLLRFARRRRLCSLRVVVASAVRVAGPQQTSRWS